MSMTYEELLQEMLDKVPSNVDKREGSVIYDALAPCAFFLAQQDFQLENYTDLVLPDTAIGEYLDRMVASYGMNRKEATAAVRKMSTSGAVEMGTRWAINDVVYGVSDYLAENLYEVTCETSGEIGNQYSGILSPLSNVSSVSATLGDIITAGTDEETDEALRNRFFTKVRFPATSGNAFHYQQWALSVPGCGAAKVFPLDNGPGTVTVLVVDDKLAVSGTLPSAVAEYIETIRPIGATVTVKSPEKLTVSVSANVLLDGTATIAKVKETFDEMLSSFLEDTVFETYKLSYAKISSLLLDVPGVEDFDSFLLNGAVANIVVGEKQIPVIGTITLMEVGSLALD